MNKKRTRTYENHEPVYFCSDIGTSCSDKVRVVTNKEPHQERLFFVHLCNSNGHQPSHSVMKSMNDVYHQSLLTTSFPTRKSRRTNVGNMEKYFTNIKHVGRLWLACRHDDVRHYRAFDRHDCRRNYIVQNLRLFTLLVSLLISYSTTHAWITTSPTASRSSHTTCFDHPPHGLDIVLNRPFLYPIISQRHRRKAQSLIFSSSNSYTSSEVQIVNDYNMNNQDSDSNTDDSNNSNNKVVLDSITTTNEYLSEAMYTNNTNDDSTSLMNDSDSFWVTSSENREMENNNNDDIDVPRPTENGGYSHTQASRAKISAANKGKVPWNKGMNRTDEVKARIAAGVRAKNRERFLQKLQEMGITEEEYEEQKRMERSAKEAERRARRTENGGYRPTDETKRKISEILKHKFASGEIKPRPISPAHVRRGFKHSEETRQKISESLRKRWSTDEAYRAKMVDMTNRVNTKEEVRQKISESLRNKWQTDDTFRNDMMTKIAARKRRVVNPETGTVNIVHHDAEHRAKISAAMKAKWQDKEYRERNLQALASRRPLPSNKSHGTTSEKSTNRIPMVPRTLKKSSVVKSSKITSESRPRQPSEITVKQKMPLSKHAEPITNNSKKEALQVQISKNLSVKMNTDDTEEAVLVRPVQPLTAPRKKGKKASIPDDYAPEKFKSDVDTTDFLNKISTLNDGDKIECFTHPTSPQRVVAQSDALLVGNGDDWVIDSEIVLPKKETKTTSPASSNGNVELLKTERRDLYDLLYGDDDESDDGVGSGSKLTDDDDNTSSTAHIHDDYDESTLTGTASPTLASIFARLEDDNLDTFDPYGLDDF